MDKLRKTTLLLKNDYSWQERIYMALELSEVEISRKPLIQITFSLADKVEVEEIETGIYNFYSERVSDEEILFAVKEWKIEDEKLQEEEIVEVEEEIQPVSRVLSRIEEELDTIKMAVFSNNLPDSKVLDVSVKKEIETKL